MRLPRLHELVDPRNDNMKISVVIPVYKKLDMFLANMEHNIPFLADCQIIVINDDPTQSIKEPLAKWPQIELIENNINLGFAGAVHKAIGHVNGDFVMLLNSDVKLRDTSYTNAIKHFNNDHNTFAVSFAQIEKDGSIVGKNRFYWLNGFFQHSRSENLETGNTGWAEGGSCLINLKKYNEIGGFDSLYNPFYWEDIDLSYRAWKHGYTVLFDSNILVEHHHESTIKFFYSDFYVTSIAYRNQLLFIWKNIQDNALLHENTQAITKQFVRSLVSDPAFISGYFRALAKKNGIMNSTKQLHTDHEILAQFSK
ncbi:hypothetical protein BH09PAT2_BH09PAT2_03730 [soil metagenome]